VIIRIVQLAEGNVTLGRFDARRGELRFLGGSSAALTNDVDLVAALQSLAEPPSVDERVVLALPPQQVALRQVQLPLTDRQKIREILPLELKGELAQDTAELLFDSLPATDGTCLAFWTSQAALSPLLTASGMAGSDAESATYAPASWGVLVPAAERQLTVALTDGSGWAVFSASEPRYFRCLVGDLATELRRTIASLELGQSVAIDRCYLFGAAAVAFTAQRDNFPVPCALLPTDGFLAAIFASDPQAARELASLAAVASVVATGEPLNFRQGSLAYTAGRERLRKSLRLPAILALCVILALFAELGVRWQLLRRDLVSLDTSIGAIYREVFPKRKPVDETAEIKAEIRRLSGSSGDSAALATLKVLADGLGEGIAG
jgi:general secretion pathway protein L